MSKETKNRRVYNTEILNVLEIKYGVTVNYIRKCLRGDRTGIIPDRLIKEYNEAVKQYAVTVENIKNNLL
ncbi:hypothetical protein [Flavobacterium sp. '19STA2R22 D10 B1']|uniref:hypothetical protein n=1 Tax=Flavobacterium aerium TaxID=3037261 RepID=UPI00278C6B5D|nr:hypothetical protein [Flavobacterium sp. '19STA2R22 D10 B1']